MEKLDNQQKIIEKIEKIVTPVVNEMGLSLVILNTCKMVGIGMLEFM